MSGFWAIYLGIEGGGGTGPGGTETFAGPLGIVSVCGRERRGRVGSQSVRFYVGPLRVSGIGSAAIGSTFVVG